MDKIFIQHGVKLADLQRAIAEFDLENDEDVKSCKNLNLASRDQMVKEKQEKMMEDMKLMKLMVIQEYATLFHHSLSSQGS